MRRAFKTIQKGLGLAGLAILSGGLLGLGAWRLDQYRHQGRDYGELALRRQPSVTPVISPTPTLKPLPAQHVIAGGTQVFQTFNNCGPASLSMLLSYYGMTISQVELGQALRPFQHPHGDNDDKSVTMKEIAAKAHELGLVAYHRPAGTIPLLRQFLSRDLPVLTRTWLKEGEDIGHFRVVKGFDEDRKILFQDDSLQGKDLAFSYTDFIRLWSGFNYEYIVLSEPSQADEVEQILAAHSDPKVAWADALQLSAQQLESDPGNVTAQFNQSVALYALGRFEEAVTAFERVEHRLSPRMLWYQIEPLVAYAKLNRFDELEPRIWRILQNDNRAFAELYYLLGYIDEARNLTSEARAHYDLATHYNSASNIWRVNLQ